MDALYKMLSKSFLPSPANEPDTSSLQTLSSEELPEPFTPLKLLVGLGNPGPRYRNTRHNLGFMVLDELAGRHNLTWRKEKVAHKSSLDSLTLIKPTTFMNLSGKAVQAYSSKKHIKLEHILIIHDDLDLPFGRLRFRSGGSAGGQRGVQDTINRLGKDFQRLKIGISRPPEGWKVENWVLSRFRAEEKALLDTVIMTATDALELALSSGITMAMNRYNGTDLGKK